MGLDAAILGMVNKILLKPSGGVDWTALTPYYSEGIVNSFNYTTTQCYDPIAQQYVTVINSYSSSTVLEITGSGYLTSIEIEITSGDLGPDGYFAVYIYMDDIVIASWQVPEGGNTQHIVFKPLWFFANNFKIVAQPTITTTDCFTMPRLPANPGSIKWIAALSIE